MNPFLKSILRVSLLTLIVATFFSCKNDKLIKRGDSLATAYKKSMAMYQSGDYTNAADGFETVIDIGRGTDYGQEAQYYLADSYFKDKRYLLAASEYERYIALFPRADKRQTAQYNEAISYYKLSPRYKLDQKYTRTAIEKFSLYQSRYPDGEHMQQSSDYITKLRNKLAEKLYHAGTMYTRTDNFKAATIYFDLTIDKYPESVWSQKALVDEIKTFNAYAKRSVKKKQIERYQKALSAYEKFLQLFPNSKYRSKADDYVNETRSALADLGEGPESKSSQDSLSYSKP